MPYGSRKAMIRTIHQKYCELPMAAAGAAASATNTTQTTLRIASKRLNFFLVSTYRPLSVSVCLRPWAQALTHV